MPCQHCGGTGDEYGDLPAAPARSPASEEEVVDTSGQKHTVLPSDIALATKLHEMCEDYRDNIEENSLRIAMYREEQVAAALRSRQPSALTGGTDGIIEEFERGRKAGHFGEAVEYPEPPTCPDCHGKGWYLEPREVGDTTAYERVNCHCIEEEEERAHEALRSRLSEPKE